MTTTPVRIALPVPVAGTALGGAGEDYVASLDVRFANEDGAGASTPGDTLEMLLMTLRIRHLAFDARTFAFSAFEVPGGKLAAMIDRNWSAVDASGQQVSDLATLLQDLASRSATISFSQSN